MRHPRPLPPILGRSFSVSAAVRAGVTERRLRHRGLETPFWGVRALPGEPGQDCSHDESALATEARALRARIEQLAEAFATGAGPACFFSHTTAAVLWGLPLPLRVLRRTVHPEEGHRQPPARGIDVAVMSPRRAPKGAGVAGHELRAELTSTRDIRGMCVSSPASTWAMLAELLTLDELVRLGDAIVHVPRLRGMKRGDPDESMATIAQLEAAMNAGRRRGVARLREALPLIRVGSASPEETDLRLACIRAGLPKAELDFDVIRRDGRPIGYTEFAYPEWRVLVEYEGDHHRISRDQWNRDIEKHAACVAEGWEVIRVTSQHLHPSPAPAVGRIRDALVRAGWRPARV